MTERKASIAIETSCRTGGVALGLNGRFVRAVAFDADARHAAQLVPRLAALLEGESLSVGDVAEVYVSAGPGSFTGLRVGITVARTLAQAADVRCVSVPTALAVAENARGLDWRNLGVVFDAREGDVYAQVFSRREGQIVPAGEPRVLGEADFLAAAPRPVLLLGEALSRRRLAGEGVRVAEASLHLPTAEGVWRAGRRLARRGRFTDCLHLLPVYVRRPEAVRLWERRGGR
jgi:tRNA threonylcarbamoyladenosine biosynthesis protein TsaB